VAGEESLRVALRGEGVRPAAGQRRVLQLGEHGEEAHGTFAYESTLRVPLIIAEVGGGTRTPGGEVSSVAARHIDILPTILDAVGQMVPSDLPGRTLLPREERRAGASPRTTYFEAMSGMLNHGWAPLTGVLVGRDKFVDLPIAERYELANDPGERTNLAGRSTERDRLLTAALGAFTPALPGQRVTEDPEAAARLRALLEFFGDVEHAWNASVAELESAGLGSRLAEAVAALRELG
jgi:arylsulfatase A-like enzyme